MQFKFVFTDVEVSCYGYEGIDAVKRALVAGLELSTEDMPIKVTETNSLFAAFASFPNNV